MKSLIIISVLVLACAGMVSAAPSDPVNLANTTGNFWISHTWGAGETTGSLISGESDGTFTGFNMTGATWQTDIGAAAGLPDIGSYSAPTVFQMGDTWYLIAGDRWGVFNGYRWTGSTWQSDTAIVSGLSDIGSYSAPTVFQMGDTWHLVSGESDILFYGYDWTGSTWQTNSSIVSGTAPYFQDKPHAVQMDGTWYLIVGGYHGTFVGYRWTGSTWQGYSAIVGGLGDIGSRAAPTTFLKDGTWYLIAGASGGTFAGFKWTGSAWQSDSAVASGLGDVGGYSTPAVFSVRGTDSYNVSVNSVWHNGSTAGYDNTYSAHAWQNITVYAYNDVDGISSGSISQNTQIPNNPITITNTSADAVIASGTNVYVDYNSSDLDDDTTTFSCSRTDIFTDFSTSTGKGNWTAVAGTYYVDFGVADGYGSTDNYTMRIDAVGHDPMDWWNASWTCREPIAVINTCGDDLDGFYVGIVLDTTQCAWADCRDIRLIDPTNNTEYTWWTASFNDGEPVSQTNEVVYVHVPHIADNETVWVYFYYNNSNDVPSDCAGMGGMDYYEDFDDAPIPPPNPPAYYVDGWAQYGATYLTSLTNDGLGGYCMELTGIQWAFSGWQNSYKLLVQPTATAAGYEFWVKPAASYEDVAVMTEATCSGSHSLHGTTPNVWQQRAMSFNLGCAGSPYTGKFWIWDTTSLKTLIDDVHLYQIYPYDPATLYYLAETKPPAISIYDATGNPVRHAQATIQNVDTKDIVGDIWQDIDDGTLQLWGHTGTFRVAVRTFDGVFVYVCDLSVTPVYEITIPLRYSIDMHTVDEYDTPIHGVFAGLAEYAHHDPQSFWGMDLSDRGYVPVTNCSGFSVCDIIAEKSGYDDYHAEALNWTTCSAMTKDYRHDIVMEAE